jgi:DNA repair exonuclease SbcCD nuclease subunit
MNRFIVFSDLHLNKWQYGAKLLDGRNTRLLDQADVLHQIKRYAVDNDIKHVLFCGDLFHTNNHISTEVLMTAIEEFRAWERAGLNLIIIPGNHDLADKSGKISALGMFNSKFTRVLNGPLHKKLDNGLYVSALPYTEDEDSLKRFLDVVPGNYLVILHQGVSGTPVNSKGFTLNEILKPDMIPDHITGVFAGHYHSHKKVNDRLWIPGSPMQLTWSDKGETRGWLDVTVDGREVAVEHIRSTAPTFVEVYADYIDRVSLYKNFVRIVVPYGTTQWESLKEKAILEGASSVEVRVEGSEEIKEKVENFSTVEDLLNEFIKMKKVTEDAEKIARDLIADKYEAPEVED